MKPSEEIRVLLDAIFGDRLEGRVAFRVGRGSAAVDLLTDTLSPLPESLLTELSYVIPGDLRFSPSSFLGDCEEDASERLVYALGVEVEGKADASFVLDLAGGANYIGFVLDSPARVRAPSLTPQAEFPAEPDSAS